MHFHNSSIGYILFIFNIGKTWTVLFYVILIISFPQPSKKKQQQLSKRTLGENKLFSLSCSGNKIKCCVQVRHWSYVRHSSMWKEVKSEKRSVLTQDPLCLSYTRHIVLKKWKNHTFKYKYIFCLLLYIS